MQLENLLEKKLKNLNDLTEDILVFLSHSYAAICNTLGNNFLNEKHLQVQMCSYLVYPGEMQTNFLAKLLQDLCFY